MKKLLFVALVLVCAYGGFRFGRIASGATLDNAEKEAAKLVPADFVEARDIGSYSGIVTGNHAYATGKKPGGWSRNNPDPAKILSVNGWSVRKVDHHASGDTAYGHKRGLETYLTFRDGTSGREGKALVEAISTITPTSLGLIWSAIGLLVGVASPFVGLKLWRWVRK